MLTSILFNQDLIEDFDSYDNYTMDCMFNDVCDLLKKDKYFKDKKV